MIASATTTPIDAGVRGIYNKATEPPSYDSTGVSRSIAYDGLGYLEYVGNGPDIGAFETSPNRSQAFSLSSGAVGSAGVFTMDNVGDSAYSKLVRTLFSGVNQQAGTETVYWNGLDDFNRPVSSNNFKIKLLTNNVTYNWDGAVGNSSYPINGISPHESYSYMHSMTTSGTSAVYTNGYNEFQEEF